MYVEDHVAKLHHLRTTNHAETVTRNHPGVWTGDLDSLIESGDGAAQAAAVIQVHNRVAGGAKYVTKMQYIGTGEVDKGIAIGVGRRGQEGANLLAVEVKTDLIVVCHHRSCHRRLLGQETPSPPGKAHPLFQEAQAGVVMGKDQYTHLCEVLVAPHMVDMDVGVDQESDLTVGHLLHHRHQFVRQGREQGVDQ